MSFPGLAAVAGCAVVPAAMGAGGDRGARESDPGVCVAQAGGADLRLAQLMCARVCHDLIGAAGAIESGIELLDEEAGDTADIHDLIGLSGRQLSRRLAFYRLAFGLAGAAVPETETGSLAEARRVTAGLVENSRIALHWSLQDGPECRAGVIRMVLCAVLAAAEALHRGGDLRVAIVGCKTGYRIAIEAAGRGARLADPVLDALEPDGSIHAVTARTVHAHYLGRLVARHAARLDVTQTTNGFRLSLAVPAGA